MATFWTPRSWSSASTRASRGDGDVGGDVGDDGALLAGDERLPPLVQPMVASVTAGLGRRRASFPRARMVAPGMR
jgi:hypothetical protein